MNLLAIDFGGTRIRAASYTRDAGGVLHQQARIETPTDVSEGQGAVIERLLRTGEAVQPHPDAIGIAAPGPLSGREGIIYHAYTLPGWENVPLAQIIAAHFGAPAFVENDANLAALAEYTAGAGRGCDPLIYLTISTGIGGGVVLGGTLFTGWSGLAAEPGHMLMTSPEGEIVRLEALASGTALGERARRQLALTDAPSLLRGVVQVDGAAVGAAAQQGDALALDLVETAGHYLGLGLVNLLHLFSPQAVVLGGSVSGLGDLLLKPARRTMAEYMLNPRFIPPDLLRPAAFGDDVCLIGAAAWAAQRAE